MGSLFYMWFFICDVQKIIFVFYMFFWISGYLDKMAIWRMVIWGGPDIINQSARETMLAALAGPRGTPVRARGARWQMELVSKTSLRSGHIYTNLFKIQKITWKIRIFVHRLANHTRFCWFYGDFSRIFRLSELTEILWEEASYL